MIIYIYIYIYIYIVDVGCVTLCESLHFPISTIFLLITIYELLPKSYNHRSNVCLAP